MTGVTRQALSLTVLYSRPGGISLSTFLISPGSSKLQNSPLHLALHPGVTGTRIQRRIDAGAHRSSREAGTAMPHPQQHTEGHLWDAPGMGQHRKKSICNNMPGRKKTPHSRVWLHLLRLRIPWLRRHRLPLLSCQWESQSMTRHFQNTPVR